MDRNNFKNQNVSYKGIMANTSALWQHAAHATNQLSSPSKLNCNGSVFDRIEGSRLPITQQTQNATINISRENPEL